MLVIKKNNVKTFLKKNPSLQQQRAGVILPHPEVVAMTPLPC